VTNDCENKSYCPWYQWSQRAWGLKNQLVDLPETVSLKMSTLRTCSYLLIHKRVDSIILRAVRGLTDTAQRWWLVSVCWRNAWMYFNVLIVEIIPIFLYTAESHSACTRTCRLTESLQNSGEASFTGGSL
jgi:hypothetical protein